MDCSGAFFVITPGYLRSSQIHRVPNDMSDDFAGLGSDRFDYMVRGISMALPTYTDPIHTALTEKMRCDKQVYIIGEDVGAMRSVFRTAA